MEQCWTALWQSSSLHSPAVRVVKIWWVFRRHHSMVLKLEWSLRQRIWWNHGRNCSYSSFDMQVQLLAIFTVQLHVMQRAILLSQFCPSVHLSVCQMCVLWQNEIIVCQYLNSIRNRDTFSLSTPMEVAGNCPVPPEIFAESDPPPSKNADFNRFPLTTS